MYPFNADYSDGVLLCPSRVSSATMVLALTNNTHDPPLVGAGGEGILPCVPLSAHRPGLLPNEAEIHSQDIWRYLYTTY